MFTHQCLTRSVGGEILAATITRPQHQPDSLPTLLIIHGAGASHHQRYTTLAENLASHGITSLRFDHSGHGASSGELTQSSLTRRLAEARAFLPLLHPSAPLAVMGASMGGHIAARLLPEANFTTFIAQVPAAYTANAEAQTFGPAFTTLIRTPGAWQNALIWPQLENFTGRFLLISAENDTVIPYEVLNAYWHHTRHAQSRSHLFLPRADHSLSAWLDQNPDIFSIYTQAVRSVIQ